MVSTFFFSSIASNGHSDVSLDVTNYMSAKPATVGKSLYTTEDHFVNYPMGEIRLSLESSDISIPSHLQTADELDEWIMSL